MSLRGTERRRPESEGLELRPTGAKVGVAYFAELDTDMTSRGFGTEAAKKLTERSLPIGQHVAPLSVGIDALERGITRRARRIVAPRYMTPVLVFRTVAQLVVDSAMRSRVAGALAVAREERVELTTPQDQVGS